MEEGAMRAVVQRVLEARVSLVGPDGGVEEETGRTRPGAPGVMVLLGAGHGDTVEDVNWMARKICGLRIFPDDRGHMNRSVVDVGGSLLVVSQFTLYGDCRKGRRPSFVGAMEPEAASVLIDRFVEAALEEVPWVQTGRFGAHMHVELTNDGPVTLILDSPG